VLKVPASYGFGRSIWALTYANCCFRFFLWLKAFTVRIKEIPEVHKVVAYHHFGTLIWSTAKASAIF